MDPSELGLLAALDALLQEGSVTGAGRRMGLSVPAVSHTLARLRALLGDPLLVRAGRSMVLTPRAEALKPRVRSVVAEAQQTLAPERAFAPATLERTFVVHATDYVLTVLGAAVDRALRAKAPGVSLRFVPNTTDDAGALREGSSDLAVGIYGALPPEMRSRELLTDRFVCVARREHSSLGRALSLEQFVALPHLQVAPRGRPGGYLDDELRARGLERRVARAVPYFLTALHLAAETDYLLTISERIAARFAPTLGLRTWPVPLPLRPYALSLLWHPRVDADPAHRFLREVFVLAAKEQAGERHEHSRRREEPARPRPRRGKSKRRA